MSVQSKVSAVYFKQHDTADSS